MSTISEAFEFFKLIFSASSMICLSVTPSNTLCSSPKGWISSPISLSLSSRISSSISGASSDGLNFDGDGGSLKDFIFEGFDWTLFRASRIKFSHFGTGRVSTATKMLLVFKGTISWRLQLQSAKKLFSQTN